MLVLRFPKELSFCLTSELSSLFTSVTDCTFTPRAVYVILNTLSPAEGERLVWMRQRMDCMEAALLQNLQRRVWGTADGLSSLAMGDFSAALWDQPCNIHPL